jgi:hypothetical protein
MDDQNDNELTEVCNEANMGGGRSSERKQQPTEQ